MCRPWDRGYGCADAARRELQFHCRQGEQERSAIDSADSIIYDDTPA
jgi:hypothetical protein